MPVRQWVRTVPYRLRYAMAWDHGLSRAVLGVYARVLLEVYARAARERGIPDGRTGTVTVIQRSGSGLNVNDRAGLERLCRYVLRPPLAHDRLRLRADGHVVVELKTAWHDGTTRLVFAASVPGTACRHHAPARGQPAVEDPAVIQRILAHLGLTRSGQSPGPTPSGPIATL